MNNQMNGYMIYIDIGEIDLYYQIHKKKIDKNRDYYISFLKSDKKLYDDYTHLCDEIMKYKAMINKTNYKQLGSGAGLIVGITIGSIAITGVVAYLLWRYLRTEDLCKKTYPLYSIQYPNKIPDVEALLMTIIPQKWISDKINKGKDVKSAIKESGDYLESLVEKLKVFDEQIGSTSTRVAKTVSKITLSTIAAILSAGTGGDKIVNVPFFFTKAIKMITKTYNELRKIGQKLSDEIDIYTKNIKKAGENAKNAIKSIEEIELIVGDSAKDAMIELHNGKETMAFIYDLFNIGFSDGPQGSLCRVNYIMNYYIGSRSTLEENNEEEASISEEKSKHIYALLCAMNQIYTEINEVVIEFIGSAIDMIVPDSLGFAGTLAPMLKGYSYDIYERVRDEITNDYNRIPAQYRELIENPLELKQYLFDKLSTYTLDVTDLVMSDDLKKQLGLGIDVFANGIHKGMGMIFMFLNVFIVFSEINAGVNKSFEKFDTEKCKQYTKK
jgi:hypothetical protein